MTSINTYHLSFCSSVLFICYRNYSNRTVDPIQRKKFNFWNFCSSNYTEGSSTNYFRVNCSHEVLLAKQNGKVVAKMSLLSLAGSVLIKTTLMKHWQRHIVVHPDHVFVKTNTDKSHWQMERCSDDRISQSLYTSKVIQYYKTIPPGAKRPPCMASAFLGK